MLRFALLVCIPQELEEIDLQDLQALAAMSSFGSGARVEASSSPAVEGNLCCGGLGDGAQPGASSSSAPFPEEGNICVGGLGGGAQPGASSSSAPSNLTQLGASSSSAPCMLMMTDQEVEAAANQREAAEKRRHPLGNYERVHLRSSLVPSLSLSVYEYSTAMEVLANWNYKQAQPYPLDGLSMWYCARSFAPHSTIISHPALDGRRLQRDTIFALHTTVPIDSPGDYADAADPTVPVVNGARSEASSSSTHLGLGGGARPEASDSVLEDNAGHAASAGASAAFGSTAFTSTSAAFSDFEEWHGRDDTGSLVKRQRKVNYTLWLQPIGSNRRFMLEMHDNWTIELFISQATATVLRKDATFKVGKFILGGRVIDEIDKSFFFLTAFPNVTNEAKITVISL